MLDRSGFDLWAKDYDNTVESSDSSQEYPFAGYKEVLNKIYGEIKAGGGKSVLDIGFGTGVLAKRLYDEGINVWGVDFSEEMINATKEKMPHANLYRHDFSKGLPKELENTEFDYIVSTYAIHHLTDSEKISFIEKLKKHLSPKGKILIGDVAFETPEAMEQCAKRAGDDWDNEEIYIVKEEMLKSFPEMKFYKISFCSGICVF